MTNPKSDRSSASPEEEQFTPWWHLLALFAVAVALCTGMCLLV